MKVFKMISVWVVLLGLAGCGKENEGETISDGSPVSVAAESAELISGPRELLLPGEVRPVHEVSVASRVSGIVRRLSLVSGDSFSEGDLLVELDSEELSARVRRAKVELEAARLELDRVRSLVGSKAATVQELEVAEARYRSARAGLDEAEVFEGYGKIHAPFDGVVVRKMVEEGDYLQVSQPVLVVHSLAGFRFEAAVSESLVPFFDIGDRFSFSIDRSEISGEAIVAEIEAEVDSNLRTVRVKADLPEDNDLRSGQFGWIGFSGPVSDRIQVSERSLLMRGELEYLFVISEGRARLRLVRTGRRFGGRVEILAGVEPGEKVVLGPPSSLRDGAFVEVSSLEGDSK